MKNLLYIAAVLPLLYFTACTSGDSANSDSQDDSTTVAEDTTNTLSADTVAYVENDTTPVDKSRPNGEPGNFSAVVGGITYGITVPNDMSIEELESFTLFCSSDEVRESSCFTLEVYDGPDVYSTWSTIALDDTRNLYYKLSKGDGDKKGEEILEGYFQLGDKWFKVTSGDASSTGEADATWFVEYLKSFKVLDAPVPPDMPTEPVEDDMDSES